MTRNVLTALDSLPGTWQPHRLASVNDYDVKVVKLLGEFVWHSHPDTDELFLVVSGTLTIQLRDGDVVLVRTTCSSCRRASSTAPGRRRGLRAAVRAQGTVNTGDAGGERTSRCASSAPSVQADRPRA